MHVIDELSVVKSYIDRHHLTKNLRIRLLLMIIVMLSCQLSTNYQINIY